MSGGAADSWDLFLDEGDEPAPASDFHVPSYVKDAAADRPPRQHKQSYPSSFSRESFSPPPRPATTQQFSFTQRPQAPRFCQVKFHSYRTVIVRNSQALPLIVGDFVITEADRGCDMGQVIAVDVHPKDREAATAKNIVRRATPAEIATVPVKQQREEAAREICQRKADEMGLPMTVTATELQFDGKKLTVYFSASRYIDFRHLVQSLFRVFGTRIWMVWYDGEAPVRDVFTHTSPQLPVPMPA